MDAEQIFKTISINLPKVKDMVTEAFYQNVVARIIEDILMGRYYHVTGNSTGRYIIVKSIAS